MRLKRFSKNSARAVLVVSFFVVFGCTTSTQPTYLKENIDEAIQDICKKEYKLDVKAKLIGSTLWIYLPLENIFTQADKPEKYIEYYLIERNASELKDKTLKVEYLIQQIPEQEKYQEIKYSKSAVEKIHCVWKVLRRVIFSMERGKRNEPQFFVLVTADIKTGIIIQELFYYLDLKKVSYEFISWTEYQHRSIQDIRIAPQIIGDKEGLYLEYKDITLEDFLANQIQHRIKLKFQKPEVEKNTDIDKEILKVIVYTLKAYGFKNFSSVELNNLVTQNKIILNQAAIWARPTE
ncbi:MAG: hypothetical protein NC928_02200 [Candidatus Omnitrophica bacterium]|nr:hypothetical protein [Candidatus Omnitrophota bacterium]